MERSSICETKYNGLLDIPLSSGNVESYICSDRCFFSLFRRFRTLKEKFCEE